MIRADGSASVDVYKRQPIESFAGMFFPAAKEVTEQYILNT